MTSNDYAAWRAAFKAYKRRKDGAGGYDVIAPDGAVIGNVVRTGEYSRDPYPWSWMLADGVPAYMGNRTTGVTDSLAEAVELIALAHNARSQQ